MSPTSGRTGEAVVIRPAPKQPDLKEYEHLTEKERMNQGYPYLPWDPQLKEERGAARKLVAEFNAAPAGPEHEQYRKGILKKLFNPNTHDNIFIEPSFRCDYGYNITLGEGAEFNFDCCILDCAPVKIGRKFLCAPNVHIYAATHPVCGKERELYELARPVTIGDNVWVGGQTVICPGVTIGNDVTIGAGSVVTRDVPSHCVVAGNPAKIIRYLPGFEQK